MSTYEEGGLTYAERQRRHENSPEGRDEMLIFGDVRTPPTEMEALLEDMLVRSLRRIPLLEPLEATAPTIRPTRWASTSAAPSASRRWGLPSPRGSCLTSHSRSGGTSTSEAQDSPTNGWRAGSRCISVTSTAPASPGSKPCAGGSTIATVGPDRPVLDRSRPRVCEAGKGSTAFPGLVGRPRRAPGRAALGARRVDMVPRRLGPGRGPRDGGVAGSRARAPARDTRRR